jgi:hypothetical protein
MELNHDILRKIQDGKEGIPDDNEDKHSNVSQAIALNSLLNGKWLHSPIFNCCGIANKKSSKRLTGGKLKKLAIRSDKVKYSHEEMNKFWNELTCWDKISLLTFFSSDLVKYIHSINTYLLCMDIMSKKEEGKQNNSKLDEITTKNEEDFQLLNALEIFWNINSENIDLLKQNWWCKCEAWSNSEPSHKSQVEVAKNVDFHVLETKYQIQGDVLTIKSEFLQHILNIWKSINADFLNGEEKELFLFKNSENMYKFFLNTLKSEKVQSWNEFETQLTTIIEYKVMLFFYSVSVENC